MRDVQMLRRDAEALVGFSFKHLPPFEDEKEVLDAFFPRSDIGDDAGMLESHATILFDVVMSHKDVYTRLHGSRTFWLLIASEWKPFLPLEASVIASLVASITSAREKSREKSATQLGMAVDSFIALRDTVGKMKKKDAGTCSLKAATELTAPDRIWPAAVLSRRNDWEVALLANHTLRGRLYGIDSHSILSDADIAYPCVLDGPEKAKHWLGLHILVAHEKDSPWALFPAPMAFLQHEDRKAWYPATDKDSRLYGTVDEFVQFARRAFLPPQGKKFAVCLLTPWFYRVAAFTDDTNGWKTRPTWPDKFARQGMALVIHRGGTRGTANAGKQRVTIFDPTEFNYPNIFRDMIPEWQPSKKAWLKGVEDAIDNVFDIYHGWIGGTTVGRQDLQPSGVDGLWDTVELSSEFITEILHDPGKLPTTPTEWSYGDYQRLLRWLPDWDPTADFKDACR